MNPHHTRVLRHVTSAAFHRDRPVLVALTITRRCNLACSYCFEYDDHSPPVPAWVLGERLKLLRRMGTVFVTMNGGEPLLHPDLVELCAETTALGMTPMLNTNGFLLTAERVRQLGDAGLYGLQLSIDSMEPTSSSRKALSVLRPKLRMLAEHARFRVRVNTVLHHQDPKTAVNVVREVAAMGFDAQCSLQRDAQGAVIPLSPESQSAYREIRSIRARLPLPFNDGFQATLAAGGTASFRCRAGARTLHIDEHGSVHPCQPRAHEGGVPLAKYTRHHIRQAFQQPKPCAARCGHAYAHITSRLDLLRGQG